MKTLSNLFVAMLSVTMSMKTRSEIVRGIPCVDRSHQLYCALPGNSYPRKEIERFIDQNKALMKRMVGDYTYSPDINSNFTYPQDRFETYDGHVIRTRSERSRASSTYSTSTNKIDSCESGIEIVTPYWASNSAGKIRAIVNTQHLQQAIQQEVCQSGQTKRCTDDCSCEQKYKWHRLLAYDPDDDCKGIFMDWFLFPSCCVCRCNKTTS